MLGDNLLEIREKDVFCFVVADGPGVDRLVIKDRAIS